MTEYLASFLNKISLLELNVLLLLGLALFGGTVGGRLFQKLRIPKVVGYIIIGIVIGRSGLGLVDDEIIEVLRPFNYFALGLIGFMVGGELKKEVFSKYGKPVIAILLCEGLAPFFLVTLFIGIVGSYLLGASPSVWALALLLGAIASATDPATTTSVLKEYKTRGPVTTNVLGIVALDDGLALILFALASTITGVLLGQGNGVVFKDVVRPLYEIVTALGIGLLAGFGLSRIIKKYVEERAKVRLRNLYDLQLLIEWEYTKRKDINTTKTDIYYRIKGGGLMGAYEMILENSAGLIFEKNIVTY